MTKLLGWVAATAIGAAIITATPAVAFHGGGFGGGMHGSGMHFAGGGFSGTGGMRMGRQVSAGGFHNPAFFRHHRHFRNVVFLGGPFFYDYVPYYYDYVPYDGNYCWQQVWIPSGWQATPALATMATATSGVQVLQCRFTRSETRGPSCVWRSFWFRPRATSGLRRNCFFLFAARLLL